MSAPNSSHEHDPEQGYEKHEGPVHINRAITSGGNAIDYSQTPLPPQHRVIGNPAPLGLVSFGCGFFIASAFNLHGEEHATQIRLCRRTDLSPSSARGVAIPNVVVPVLILYGGIAQFSVGMWELFTGNTFGAT